MSMWSEGHATPQVRSSDHKSPISIFGGCKPKRKGDIKISNCQVTLYDHVIRGFSINMDEFPSS